MGENRASEELGHRNLPRNILRQPRFLEMEIGLGKRDSIGLSYIKLNGQAHDLFKRKPVN